MGLKNFYLFLLLFLLPLSAGAAAAPSSVAVDVAPENPSPGETVTVSLSSYTYSLDALAISWSVGGKPVASGIGKKSISATAPQAGEELRITASIALPDDTLQKTVLIRPVIMALLWQANDSYAPPFYRGKALPAPGSQIKVVAMPEIKSGGQLVSAKNLVYAWKKNYTNDQPASGYGKNYYIFTDDYLEGANNISVAASTVAGDRSSSASIDLRTFDPKIVFYRRDPALGTLWETAIQNGYRIEEAVLEASPYFISPKDIRVPSFEWSWSINGRFVAASLGAENVIPLKATPGVSGTSRIKVGLMNKYNLLTSVEKEIDVEF